MHTAAMEKILMMAFCSMLISPQGGVEEKGDIGGQIGVVVGQRTDVPLQRSQMRAGLGILLNLLGQHGEADQPRQADEGCRGPWR